MPRTAVRPIPVGRLRLREGAAFGLILSATGVAEAWASRFVKGLLDVDFAREHRSAPGSFLVAE